MTNIQTTEVGTEIEYLLSNKELFSSYVYMSMRDAVNEIEKRRNNVQIDEYLKKVLPLGLPNVLDENGKNLVLWRHIATPNFETCRFLAAGDTLSNNYKTHIFEYTQDKFNDRNESKYFLGKLRFHNGFNKNKELIFENSSIINFNESNNAPISELKTRWGQNLVDFHHTMFDERFGAFTKNRHDISEWIQLNGSSAKEYYKPFLSIFLKNGILFENFLTSKAERKFTLEVVLPIFFEIEKESGFKPLIVSLDPSELEGDAFWLSYPYDLKKHIN